MTTERYAIYYAPAADSALWHLGCRWLGRDAASGETVPRMMVPGLNDIDLDHLTASPRHYGFHATLKAPFELAAGRRREELLACAKAFASGRPPFDVVLVPRSLGRFLALRMDPAVEDMTLLHTDCVREFDEFRAPLNEGDIARREKAGLSARQRTRLLEWGYPWIFDEFRFHMTLTGAIADDELRVRVLEALQKVFGRREQRIDAVAVYHQPDRDSAFTLAERFEFAG